MDERSGKARPNNSAENGNAIPQVTIRLRVLVEEALEEAGEIEGAET
jgi:hypothetical protein